VWLPGCQEAVEVGGDGYPDLLYHLHVHSLASCHSGGPWTTLLGSSHASELVAPLTVWYWVALGVTPGLFPEIWGVPRFLHWDCFLYLEQVLLPALTCRYYQLCEAHRT
jgi:hypothetical protein